MQFHLLQHGGEDDHVVEAGALQQVDLVEDDVGVEDEVVPAGLHTAQCNETVRDAVRLSYA